MLKWLGKLADSNEKELGRLQPVVAAISALEPEFEALSPEALRAKTDEFKARLEAGEGLDALLPQAFAAVREAAKRAIGQRHFNVQLMGGIVLHQGKIAEMKTGEGKTLVATLPLYLNSLTGQGCHLITVNDYLAKRDAYWMGPIYHALGVSVASIQHEISYLYDPEYESDDARWSFLRPVPRRQAYEADITYGTNNEFGFDYLRDNMVTDLSQCVQRGLNFAIVDEVDNILIDEARTPLIISGQADEPKVKYHIFARLIPRLREDEDYAIDERSQAVTLTGEGIARMEDMLRKEGLLKSPNLYEGDEDDPLDRHPLTYYLESALKAHFVYKEDRDYVVRPDEDGQRKVIIIDEFTGRLMFGRRYAEGLHQAIEAKEGVKIERESLTLATITFQNYFRMYRKLAGMTGTAATEAEEFHKIYKLEVLVIPTNEPMIRVDHTDQIYRTEEAKFRAVAGEIEGLHGEGHPVLVGTVSIEKSEYLSEFLKRKGIPHEVLNAKHHEKEAGIIAQAGQPGVVTVATNMAGRGVDIVLGPGVAAKGGLHVVGTERHEARRIDNQLRGRSGRQGDPGSSRFYVSLEDDVMRRFGGDRIGGIMDWVGMGEDVPIEHSLVTKAIENAQVKVEGYHFDIRKHLVEYDDVINKHREVFYEERKKILSGIDLKANIQSMIREELSSLVAAHLADEDGIGWNLEGLFQGVGAILPLPPELSPNALSNMSRDEIEVGLMEHAEAAYGGREQELGPENMRMLERLVMLRTIGGLWVEHLTRMDEMRQGIGLRAYGQRDPLVAYKKEAHAQFQSLLDHIQRDVVHTIYRVSIVKEGASPEPAPKTGNGRREMVAAGEKVGRNAPCPCGSRKKYKKCCGR
jgi:preprotein translocase subunit SecA